MCETSMYENHNELSNSGKIHMTKLGKKPKQNKTPKHSSYTVYIKLYRHAI